MADYVKGEIMELDLIIAEIKRATEKKAVRLVFSESENISALESKLGGAPYWDAAAPYPRDSKGKTMPLLLQLNLSEIKINTALLKRGMLQFFISADGECEYKVVYHEKISPDFKTPKRIKTLPSDGFSPVLNECRVDFKEIRDYIGVNDKDFERIFHKTVKRVTGKETTGDISDSLSDGECKKLFKELTASKSKLFGYPCFIQSDPREKDEALLLQLDSDGKNIMWGDYGVGNFFIDKKDLKNRNFSKVRFYWDCY